MADLQQLERALRSAHSAGDAAAARRLAQAIRNQQNGVPAEYREVGRYQDGTIYETPDGTLSFTSPGYSTTNQEQIRNMLGGDQPLTPDVSTAEGVARSGVQGASFYTGDELIAAGAAAMHPVVHGQSGTDFSERYDAYLARERERNERFKETNPKTALAAEVAGGVVGAGTAAGSGVTFLKGAKGARQLAMQGAKEGAVYGSVAGAGYAEGGADDRLDGFLKGGAAGGVTGGVATPVFAGMSALGRGLVERVRRRFGLPENQAAARVRHAVDQSGMSADDVAAKLDDLGPDGMLMDAVGEEGRSLARTTANLDSTAREALVLASKSRMAGQPDRLSDSLRKASGLDQSYTVKELTEAVGTNMKPDIDAAYDTARSLGYDIDLNSVDDLLQTGAGKSAFAEGQKLARDRMIAEAARTGKVGPEVLKNGPSNLSILDETKRSLDARAAPAIGQPQTNEQSIAGMLSKTIRDRIDENMPEYAGARDLARTRHQRQDAIQLGAEGAKPRVPADFPRRVEATNPAHRTDVAQGYTAGKLDQIENRRGTPGLVDAVFGSPRQQSALSLALQDKAAGVQRQIGAERAFGHTHAELSGNSTTARQLAEMGGFGETGASVITGEPGTSALAGLLARHLVPGGVRKMSQRNNAAVAPKVADILKGRELPQQAAPQTPRNPAIQRLLMRFLAQQGGAVGAGL